jgi:hypothetical protein
MMKLESLVAEKGIEILKKSRLYLTSFVHTINDISGSRGLDRIVCYGIGKISESTISRHQLAFLERVTKQLDIQGLEIWDPLITTEEWDYYMSMHYTKTEFPTKAKGLTLFYMPHCDLHVYDQLLSSQEHTFLQNVIIFGNDFAGYTLRDPTKLRSTFINKLKYNTEHIDSVSYDRGDVFNDCCFMHNFRLKPSL